jgi:hypothetical protein
LALKVLALTVLTSIVVGAQMDKSPHHGVDL